jgi:titin
MRDAGLELRIVLARTVGNRNTTTLLLQSVSPGSRVNTTFQFGFVSLDIINATTMDQGEYTVELMSSSGSVHSTAKLTVQARREMEPDYSKSEMMRQVEVKQSHVQQQQQVVEVREQPPQRPEFVKNLKDQSGLNEGANMHLEAKVQKVKRLLNVDMFQAG